MGIYYVTYLYAGRFVSKGGERAYDQETNNLNRVTFLNGEIQHKPGQFLVLSCMDRILEEREITAARVDKREVQQLIERNYPENVNTFQYENGDVFICETSYTTYESPIQEYVIHNIKVY